MKKIVFLFMVLAFISCKDNKTKEIVQNVTFRDIFHFFQNETSSPYPPVERAFATKFNTMLLNSAYNIEYGSTCGLKLSMSFEDEFKNLKPKFGSFEIFSFQNGFHLTARANTLLRDGSLLYDEIYKEIEVQLGKPNSKAFEKASWQQDKFDISIHVGREFGIDCIVNITKHNK